jgi:hypothetical protein
MIAEVVLVVLLGIFQGVVMMESRVGEFYSPAAMLGMNYILFIGQQVMFHQQMSLCLETQVTLCSKTNRIT